MWHWHLKEGLVVGTRSMPGNPYDGHTLYEALEQAEILSNVKPQMAFVDRGYRGVEIDGVQIWKSGQKRGVTRGLKAMIKRRNAIKSTIGHMKSDGKLGRNWFKGAAWRRDARGDSADQTQHLRPRIFKRKNSNISRLIKLPDKFKDLWRRIGII